MRTILLAMLLLLGACATVPATAPAYTRAPEPPAGLTNVYIYRIGAYPTLRVPTVSIDGTPVIRPAERAYTVVALTPGAHEVYVNWSWDTGWPDLRFAIDVEESKPLYLKISGGFDRMGVGAYLAETSTRRVSQAVAEPEISACCRYIHPLTGR